jgi:hypothetical protein
MDGMHWARSPSRIAVSDSIIALHAVESATENRARAASDTAISRHAH